MSAIVASSFSGSFFSRVNAVLRWLVFVIALYILCAPLLPQFTHFLSRSIDPGRGYVYQSRLAQQKGEGFSSSLLPPPAVNTLVIPKIGVDSPILEGTSPATLNLGVWRRPRSALPGTGGNTVLVAHRYMYFQGPNTFYALDQLRSGDRFLLFWEGREYDYEVIDVRVVEATATDIERNTSEEIITLYTCTPLWTSQQRLVVRARPV